MRAIDPAVTSAAPLADDPLWYKDAVIYQLHVKSFMDSNNDGIGDFKGLIGKLDYIADLGVNTIWLLPFYPSPRRDDGYDIADYRSVSPDYGTMADFKEFVRLAHARGMRVIIELVINHTSDQHPWFQRARKAKPGSAARDYYVWSETDQKFPETRIIFLDTEKSNWTWDAEANAYFWHRFYSHQPDLNFDNPRVLKEILSVMRFWLDMGVDGLRLDAIPYLIEREGTNNENLPETHVVLKKIRAALDASYKNRMLLAEANQWPEDTQLYFGEGDECHMAFHFPLMPRMYMAIAKEDRFSITDIMRQTPDIPQNCQWAIFLRNHDELTLEMVTDEERDYLWNTYASDRRARINLGIRRRLAPLLQRDRRRIELMNGLLLSMPGTPVIYYGDEIGMGDNIHLGDRDGVRTPMQWSEDRNGGFSRADPSSVVLPPVLDPLYGYGAVNVEIQSRDPHSLLNWMRRLLLLRRNHQAFGRGTLRFIYPRNRRILAYFREFGDKTILCVANLSRMPQAVDLDLSAYAGRVPVEITGPSPFPPIGALAYLLTLPPYGFFWFDLQPATSAPDWHESPPDMLPEFETFVLRDTLEALLSSVAAKATLGGILPEYLGRRRWFAAKNEAIRSAHFAYCAPLPGGTEVFLSEIDVDVGDRRERYLVPLGASFEQGPSPMLPQQLALARVRHKRHVGYLTDAFALEAFVRSLLDGIRSKVSIETDDGVIRFKPTEFASALPDLAAAAIQWLSAEQSNSSLIIGDAVMMKLIRRIVPGTHPEAEMTRHLTEAGYANAARMLGEVVRIDSDGVPHTLAILQANIKNQGDAWTFTLDTLKREIEEAELIDTASSGAERNPFDGLDAFSALIGKRLAELHLVLAKPSKNPDFAPAPADEHVVAGWANAAMESVERAFAALGRARDSLSEENRSDIVGLTAQREALLQRIGELAESGIGSLTTRVHGDFHLGQVLLARDDAFIIDFEGEPLRSLAERRARTTPLRDVAGLLRSFDYAAASIARSSVETPTSPNPIRERRMVLLKRYRAQSQTAFLDAYWGTIADAADNSLSEPNVPLLDLMLIEKVAYEIDYEAANRPDWLPIPLKGFIDLVEKLLSPG
ncbi:MAG: maltose alpha-D-glucosyltransferase [Beijerinckiaceae bacterium]|nr:maltose alpha-D-glucosyltransferase [Beijerinckiaceae bacterium]